jgi:uncharacterized protein involved in response to NO
MSQPKSDYLASFNLFALGFRAFFLFAGLAGLLLIVLKARSLSGDAIENYYGELLWHSHEMIFGYTAAVIAGFLLTAVGNWTGRVILSGRALGYLALLWIYGRIIPFFADSLPHGLIAAVDLAFLPTLAAVIGVPIVRAQKYPNLIFVAVLVLMAVANTLVHAEVLGIAEMGALLGTKTALVLVILLILVLAGRVFPFFTERRLPGAAPRRSPLLDRWSLGSFLGWFVADALFPEAVLSGMLALLAAGLHGARLWGWYDRRIWSVPLLWVLYLGYGWIILGLVFQALAAFGWLLPFLAVHAFTVGGIGVLTLGMMARVSLGHTGRPLKAADAVAVSFVLINIAALVRVLLPVVMPSWYSQFVLVSAMLWISAFALFLYVYTPILIAPRADGRPG